TEASILTPGLRQLLLARHLAIDHAKRLTLGRLAGHAACATPKSATSTNGRVGAERSRSRGRGVRTRPGSSACTLPRISGASHVQGVLWPGCTLARVYSMPVPLPLSATLRPFRSRTVLTAPESMSSVRTITGKSEPCALVAPRTRTR